MASSRSSGVRKRTVRNESEEEVGESSRKGRDRADGISDRSYGFLHGTLRGGAGMSLWLVRED